MINKKNNKKSDINKHKKQSIHPRYRTITVEMLDGSTFQTRSTCASEHLRLDMDIKTHPV